MDQARDQIGVREVLALADALVPGRERVGKV